MERLKSIVRQKAAQHRHFMLYIVIGLSGVALDYLLFVILTKAFGVDVLLANFIAISAGIVNNFWLNTIYNFKVRDHLWKRFALFYGVGALGLMLSEFLIFVLHYALGLDSLLAKLATLPAVLLFQFFFNKRFSFGDMKQTSKQLKKIFFHWPFYIVLTVYGLISLLLVATIPANFNTNDVRGGPDEAVHYRFNVEFIKKYHKLPISGQDDIEALKACRTNPIGLVPCVYSYNIYPGPNYVAGAISAALFGGAGLMSPQTAARIPALLSGLVFVTFAYAAAYSILKRRLYSTLIVASIALIPQVIFTNSYTNLDAHSLAISAVLGFTLVRFMQQPQSRKRQIWLAIALFGLLPVSKYNYFILGVSSLALIVYTFVKHAFTRQQVLRFAGYAAVSFLVLSSFWYIRNIVQYHDVLGQGFLLDTMAKYHELGTSHTFSIGSVNMLIHLDFFNILFRSFFFGFGLMNFFLAEYDYKLILFLLLSCVSLFAYNTFHTPVAKKELQRLLLAVGLWALTFLGTLLFIVYNSVHYDFQPQGRYMYPVLIPTVLILAYAIKQNARNRILPFLLMIGTAFIFLEGADMFIKVYFSV